MQPRRCSERLPQYYGRWEGQATTLVDDNQDAPQVGLPWTPGGGQDAGVAPSR